MYRIYRYKYTAIVICHMWIHMHLCMYVRTYVRMHACMHECMYVCTGYRPSYMGFRKTVELLPFPLAIWHRSVLPFSFSACAKSVFGPFNWHQGRLGRQGVRCVRCDFWIVLGWFTIKHDGLVSVFFESSCNEVMFGMVTPILHGFKDDHCDDIPT